MVRLPKPGADDGTWGDILNDFLSQSHNSDGTLKTDAVGTANLQDDSVQNTRIKNGAITASKLSASGGISGDVLTKDTTISGNLKWQTISSGSSGPVGPAGGDLAGTYPNPTVPDLIIKANDASVVHLSSTETITGAKDFTGGATIDGTNIVVTNDSRLSNQRTPLDSSVTTAKIIDGAVTEAKLSAGTQTKLNNKVDKNELVFDVKDFGATGDGTTDDTTAIAAALTAAGTATVYFPPGTYVISALTVAGSVLDGQGAATLKRTSASGSAFITVSATSTIRSLTLDGNNLISNNLVTINNNVTNVVIEDCTLKNASSPGIGIRIHDGNDRTMVRRCVLDGIFQSIYIDGTVTDSTIQENIIKNWVQRGIYVVGTATTATNRLSILKNKITGMAAGGSVRQPIAVQGNDAFSHTSMKVSGNTVIGPNKSWTAADPGTADQISIQHVVGFQMCDNISLYGGDNGMVATLQCSDGVMSGNVAMYNDTGGMDLGSASTTYARNISVTGNTFTNNGQNRNSDRNAVGRVGIRAYTAVNCIIAGNTLGDEQLTKTQQYGVAFTNCTNIVYGPDINAGNAIALYYLDSGNSGVATAVGGVSGQPVQGAVLRLPGTTSDYTSTPSVSSWTPGDLDIRAIVTPTTWASGSSQVIIGQTDVGTTDKSFYFYINASGHLALGYSTNGTSSTLINSTVAVPGSADAKTLGVRVTFDVDNGGGAGTVTFYTSTDNGASWTSFDTKPTTGTSALHKSSHAIYVGIRDGSDVPFTGLIHFAEIRDGINGSVVADVDYRGHWTGTDIEGNVWTIAGTAWSWIVVEATVFGLVADLAALQNPATATPPTYDVYSTAGSFTWTKPAGAVTVDSYCIGGGGGGASGRQGASATARCGGGGGGGGIRSYTSVLASSLGATENVVVGAGGNGGAAVATSSTDGNAGALGTASSFGTSLPRISYARMGLTGNGGTAATGTGGAATAPGASVGQAAGTAGAAGGNAGGTSTSFGTAWTAGGGGGGGGITTADAVSAGGTGSPNGSDSTTSAGGTAGGGNGNNGTTVRTGSYLPGGGGAGGGSSISGTGGTGGSGIFGGGGGGGGASLNGNNSGAGGNGGAGLVVVVSHFS